MKVETWLGALIAASILFVTGFVAIFQQDGIMSWRDISEAVWWTLGGGTVLSFLKDYNAISARRALLSVTKSGNAHSPAIVGILAAVMASLMLSGCTGTKAAYKAAVGAEETAFVLGEHYYALVRQANELAGAGQLVGSSLSRAQDVVRITKPVVDELIRTSLAYAAYTNAATEEDLQRAITDAAIAISRLVDAIKGASGRTSLTDSIEQDLKVMRAQHPFMRVAA